MLNSTTRISDVTVNYDGSFGIASSTDPMWGYNENDAEYDLIEAAYDVVRKRCPDADLTKETVETLVQNGFLPIPFREDGWSYDTHDKASAVTFYKFDFRY